MDALLLAARLILAAVFVVSGISKLFDLSGSRYDHAYANLAGRARVAIGHVCRGLLMARVNDANCASLRVEGVKRTIELDTRERKNRVDAIRDK